MALGALPLCTAAQVHAGGFEVPENGSVALGRGGAVVARASDPSTMATNVAGLAALPGFQVTISATIPALSQCFTRKGRYDGAWNGTLISTSGTTFSSSDYATAGASFPRVCNEPTFGVLPQLLASYRFGEKFAVGLGGYPPSTVGAKQYPRTVSADLPNGGSTSAPGPQRYMMVRSGGLLVYPTLAVAWAPVHWLRVGAAFQPSFARAQGLSYASASGGQSPSADVSVNLDAQGVFFAGNIGVQVVPHPSWSFGAHVHLSQTPRLRGTATQTLNPYTSDPATRVNFGVRPGNAEVDFVLPPVQARMGARYTVPREGRVKQTDTSPERSYDPMRDDVLDVEFDLIYEAAGANQYLHVMSSTPEANFNYPRSTCPKTLPAGAGITADVCFPRYWKDVVGLRIGSDVNVIPDQLAVRAGLSLETGAQSTRGANLDALSHDTIGAHLGGTFRPRPWLNLHFAYAHYFMRGIDAADGELPAVRLGGTLKPEQCAQALYGAGACANNRGLFEARLDMFNVGATTHF
jgi:long-subunit fatty acid transport protein